MKVKSKYNFEERSKTEILSFYDEDNVVALRIIPSGWSSPQRYHCLLEWGEYETTDHHLFTKDEIKKFYNIDIPSQMMNIKLTPEQLEALDKNTDRLIELTKQIKMKKK